MSQQEENDRVEPLSAPPAPERMGFRRLRKLVLLSSLAVLLVPLSVMLLFGYQFDEAIRSDARKPIARLTAHIRQSLESFFDERLSILSYAVQEHDLDSLGQSAELAEVLSAIRTAFPTGAFVDLGLLDATGVQVAYAGGFSVEGRDYREQAWYPEVMSRGLCISDVYLGYRGSPHFTVAIGFEKPASPPHVLRATLSAKKLTELMATDEAPPESDVFLVNREGILQTPSRRFGEALEKCPLELPSRIATLSVVDTIDENGESLICGYAAVEKTPYVLVVVERPEDVMGKWYGLRNELIGFLFLSSVVILGVIVWGTNHFVHRLREADRRRVALLHEIEYSNRMASIGRLAAGVAHEINNPLAIIGEKAGLLHDIVGRRTALEDHDRYLALLGGVIDSVKRCSTITHRLLGFARHMNVHSDAIDLRHLVEEVYGFLEKEAAYRSVEVRFASAEDCPTITSDRGQLQQVFLNLMNNALMAVADGGHIEVDISRRSPTTVAVSISDDGVGIPEENLTKIFEPFFTTKRKDGVGLGLSITYGIVRKLGGDIHVESEVNVGTRFTVTLPIGGVDQGGPWAS